ncbi:MAG: hypothetical protein PHW04_00905 [Candidatus Wallbacteria bacterium]|nr:hypothetical protein [Candidatus Wallbacteria bacterium]
MLLEILARSIYTADATYGKKAAGFRASMATIETLFLGSSHMERAINPEFLAKPAFNLSFKSQDHYYDLKILESTLGRMKKLSAVIIGVDWFSLGFDEAKKVRSYTLNYYREWGILPEKQGYKTFFYYSQFLTHRKSLLPDLLKKNSGFSIESGRVDDARAIDPRNYTVTPDGFLYLNLHHPPKVLDNDALKKVETHMSVNYDSAVILDNLANLEAAAALCRKSGVKLLLVTPPYSSYYRKYFPEDVKAKFYRSLGYCQSIKHLDYSNSEAFSDDDFSDADHLNAAGAKKFTEMIANDL